MNKERALLQIGSLLSVYEDDEWDFVVSCHTHQELVEVEMKKRKVFGEN